jgi:two-component system chemotaxis response regulator CheV
MVLNAQEFCMVGLLEDIKQRTQLVGHNRLELLLFQLGTDQRFAINVFKVREVIVCPRLSWVPNAHPSIRGIANIRGNTMFIIDLGMALGREPLEDPEQGFVIVSEFNKSVQGFVVSAVDRIINMNWEEILPPPEGRDGDNYLTAVTQFDADMIEVVDVEKVLAEVMGTSWSVSASIKDSDTREANDLRHVLVVDDSSVARNQIKRTLEQVGVECTTVNNGREALEILQGWASESAVAKRIAMVISDIEMPEMDGYTLTAEIRSDPRLEYLYVLLHSSLSGVFNNAMVGKVGADEFIPKFSADELAEAVLAHVHRRKNALGVSTASPSSPP